jgi:hypothetical protein
MQRERIVAIGLLTQRDVRLLGPTFDRLWPVEEGFAHSAGDPSEQRLPDFPALLRAIDEADEQLRRCAEGGREELAEPAA